MQSIDLLRSAFEDLHGVLRDDTSGLDWETLEWRAGPGVNTIGFLLWHIVRDEDVVVSSVCKLPQVWVHEGFAQRLDLPADPQGTGMEPEAAAALRYDIPTFIEYAERVWERTGTALSSLSPKDLELAAWPGSDWSIAQQLVEGCLGHSWLHLGEIRLCRGLLGWRGPE